MGQNATSDMIVMFEDEVRAAARAFRELGDFLEKPEGEQGAEERNRLLNNALRLADTALAGCDDENRVILMCSRPDIVGKLRVNANDKGGE